MRGALYTAHFLTLKDLSLVAVTKLKMYELQFTNDTNTIRLQQIECIRIITQNIGRRVGAYLFIRLGRGNPNEIKDSKFWPIPKWNGHAEYRRIYSMGTFDSTFH